MHNTFECVFNSVLHLRVGFSSVEYIFIIIRYFYLFILRVSPAVLFSRSDACNHFRFLLYCCQQRQGTIWTYFYFFCCWWQPSAVCQCKETRFRNPQFYFSDHVSLTHSFIGLSWVHVCVCLCVSAEWRVVSLRELIFIHFTSIEIGRYDDIKVNADSSVASS